MYLRAIRKPSTRLLVGLLLLPALAFRVLVPQGFMLGTGAGDAPTMQMCHGGGPLPASTQPRSTDDDPAPGQGQQHEAPCIFAAAGAAAPPPPAAPAFAASQPNDVGTSLPAVIFVAKALYRAQAARAPPARLALV